MKIVNMLNVDRLRGPNMSPFGPILGSIFAFLATTSGQEQIQSDCDTMFVDC